MESQEEEKNIRGKRIYVFLLLAATTTATAAALLRLSEKATKTFLFTNFFPFFVVKW